MNIHINSKRALKPIIENNVYEAYQNNERSLDFLVLFSITDKEASTIIDICRSYPVVLDAKWRFDSLIFTVYLKH